MDILADLLKEWNERVNTVEVFGLDKSTTSPWVHSEGFLHLWPYDAVANAKLPKAYQFISNEYGTDVEGANPSPVYVNMPCMGSGNQIKGECLFS